MMAVKDEAVFKRIVMGVTIVLKLPINVSTAAVKVFIKYYKFTKSNTCKNLLSNIQNDNS